jgi:hypothetical protein
MFDYHKIASLYNLLKECLLPKLNGFALKKRNMNTAQQTMLKTYLNTEQSSVVGLPTGSGVPGLSGLLKGSLAVIGDWPVSGRDSPCLFTALTRKL